MKRSLDTLRGFWLATGAILVAILLAVAISGLSGGYQRTEPLEVTVVLKAMNPQMEFWQVVRRGIEASAREHLVEIRVVGPWLEQEIDEQIRVLRSAIVQEPDGIVLAAADFNRLAPIVDEARAAGIPVVTLDSDVDGEAPLSFIGTNNVEAGRKAGTEMLGLVGEGGRIAVVSHIPEAATAIDREQGVFEVLRNGRAGATIGPLYAFNNERIAREIVGDLIAEWGELDGIIALNETSTVGIARAIDDLGLAGQVRIVGFDASIDEIALLERGVVDALVVQKPFNMGHISLEVLAAALRGDDVEVRIDTGSEVVRRSNMYDEAIQRLIFPLAR